MTGNAFKSRTDTSKVDEDIKKIPAMEPNEKFNNSLSKLNHNMIAGHYK